MKAKNILIIVGTIFIIFVFGKLTLKWIFSSPKITIEKTFDKDFNKINVSSGIETKLIKSDSNKIIIKTYENTARNLSSEVKDGELILEWEGWSWFKKQKAEITVFINELEKVKCSSGAQVNSKDNFSNDTFTLKSSSGSEVKLKINTDTLISSLSSGAEVDLEGNSNYAKITISSGGEFDAKSFKIKSLNCNLSSGGELDIAVSDSAWGDISSGGELEIIGDPAFVDIQTNSGGEYKIKN